MSLTATIHGCEKSVYSACLFACPWFIYRCFILLRLERAWKETVMFELKAASRILVAATEECHGKYMLRLPDSETRLEVGTFRMRNIKAKKLRNVHITQHCAGLRYLHVVLPELFVMQ